MSKSERMDCWRKIDREMRIAPDGSAELSLERAPFTHGIEGCHELWINYKNGQKRRIAKLSEADPGSGTSFSFAWSKDSKAVLLYGQTSGFNCKRSRWREFGSVYTLADEKLREVELK